MTDVFNHNSSADDTIDEFKAYKRHFLKEKNTLYSLLGIGVLTTSSIFFAHDCYPIDESFNNFIPKVKAVNLYEGTLENNQISTGNDEYDKLEYQRTKLGLTHKIESFEFLKENWNGYGARPISSHTIQKAKDTLFALQGLPEIFVTGRNSIQFEYENYQTENYLEIEIFEDTIKAFSIINGLEEDTFTVEDIDVINKKISFINVA